MIAIDVDVGGGRSAVVYVPTLERIGESAALASAMYWDEEDLAREPLLRRLIDTPSLHAVVFPTLPQRDVLQVFLRGEGGEDDLLFACAMITLARLDELLRDGPVVEGFTLQVARNRHLTLEAVRAAVIAWVERTFPDLPLPSITVEHWTGPAGLSRELLDVLLAGDGATASANALPAEVDLPDPTVAQPPYGGVAA